MRKYLKFSLIFLLAVLFILSAVGIFAGSKKEEEAAKEKKEAVEKAAEAPAGMYPLYESYLKAAKEGKPFPGNPGKGKKLAFANFSVSFPFCYSVQQSIIEIAKLAGFEEKDLIILDNQADSTLGLQNADIILSRRPNGFIEFQLDAKVNAIVGKKFKDAGVPVVAIDIEVPGAPFMGVDNYGVAYQTGKWIIEEIDRKFGGIDNTDLIIIGMTTRAGEIVMLRAIGIKDALIDKYGKDIEKKIVMDEQGSTAETGEALVSAVLAAHPDAEKIVITTGNDQTIRGAISAVEAVGTLEKENIIYVAQGADESGIEMLRNGEIDGDLAYFPERYGWYAVSAIAALMQKSPVPPYIFIENEVITPGNVNKFYPKK